jgi:hypothetical protein
MPPAIRRFPVSSPSGASVYTFNEQQIPLLLSLTFASYFIITATFVISMINRGIDSLFTVPIVFGLTFFHHNVILVIEHRRARLRPLPYYSASSSLAGILGAALLTLLWLGSFATTLLITVTIATKPGGITDTFWQLIAQCVLIPLETIIMVVIVVRSIFERTYGRSGAWRTRPVSSLSFAG